MGRLQKFALVVCLTIGSNSFSYCQERVEAIKNYCDLVNRHPGRLGVSLGEQELGSFGGHLYGYFRGDRLIKITRSIAHVSILQEDYYFDRDTLVYASYRKFTADDNDSTGSEINFICSEGYYFDNNKIIKKEITGSRKRSLRRETKKSALQKSIEYKRLLISRGKTSANSVFIKLWLDGKHSTLNRYFAFVVS
jgi:hypothetical protein